MQIFHALLFLFAALPAALGEQAVTVQAALKLLPPNQAKNVVRIEAREGTLAPESWYILVYDASDENGLREFAVSGKKITASRTLSQFLDGIKPEDVVGAKLVKIDSDELIRRVQQYIEANKLAVGKINYTMFREAPTQPPVWKLSCLDVTGKKIAEMVVNARTGNIVSHDGFALAPGGATPALTPLPLKSAMVRPTVAVVKATPSPSATPKPKQGGGLFQKMFGGKEKKPPQPPR